VITFNAIYDRVISGTIGNWLAIIGLLSLIYWVWLITSAIQRRKAAVPFTTALGIDSQQDSAKKPVPPIDPSDDDIAVIAAAVHSMFGASRLVTIGPDTGESHWQVEGRWMQQTSHKSR
jgi:hypothetical protein